KRSLRSFPLSRRLFGGTVRAGYIVPGGLERLFATEHYVRRCLCSAAPLLQRKFGVQAEQPVAGRLLRRLGAIDELLEHEAAFGDLEYEPLQLGALGNVAAALAHEVVHHFVRAREFRHDARDRVNELDVQCDLLKYSGRCPAPAIRSLHPTRAGRPRMCARARRPMVPAPCAMRSTFADGESIARAASVCAPANRPPARAAVAWSHRSRRQPDPITAPRFERRARGSGRGTQPGSIRLGSLNQPKDSK